MGNAIQRIAFLFKGEHFFLEIEYAEGVAALLKAISPYQPKHWGKEFEIVNGNTTDFRFYFYYYSSTEGLYCRCGTLYFIMDKGKQKIVGSINERRYKKHLEQNKGLQSGTVKLSLLLTLYDNERNRLKKNHRKETTVTLGNLPGFSDLYKIMEQEEDGMFAKAIDFDSEDISFEPNQPLSLLVPHPANENQESVFWLFLAKNGLAMPSKANDRVFLKERVRRYLKVNVSMQEYIVLDLRYGFGLDPYQGVLSDDVIRSAEPSASKKLQRAPHLHSLAKKLHDGSR